MTKWDLVWLTVVLVTGFVNTWQEISRFRKVFRDMQDYILARDKCYQEMMIDYAKKEIDKDSLTEAEFSGFSIKPGLTDGVYFSQEDYLRAELDNKMRKGEF